MTDAPIEIPVLVGPPGCGKTTEFRKRIMASTGLHVLALPIIDLIREQADKFAEEAPGLKVFQAHSGTDGRRRVQDQLDRRLASIRTKRIKHSVILTTHETLMTADLSAFDGSHFWIDEPPNAVVSGKIKLTRGSRAHFKANFALDPDGGWSILQAKDGAPTRRELASDSLLGATSEFHDQVRRRDGLLVNIADWNANEFDWFGIWSPLDLPRWASLTIGGAGYLDSVGAQVVRRWQADQIEFVPTPLPYQRTGQPQITIRYFTEHECTTRLWETSQGRLFLKAIADHLGPAEPELGFWSGNEVATWLLEHRVHGAPTEARLAGLNKHRQKASCGFFYSSKATPEDQILVEVFGLSKDGIRRAREDEDIHQFVCRGIIRDPNYDGPYSIYLYSREQAQRLMVRLLASGFSDVTLTPVIEAGIVDAIPEKPKPGRKPTLAHLSPDEWRARKTSQKAEQRRQTAGKPGKTL